MCLRASGRFDSARVCHPYQALGSVGAFIIGANRGGTHTRPTEIRYPRGPLADTDVRQGQERLLLFVVFTVISAAPVLLL